MSDKVKATLKDVAESAQVSASLVSKVLNGRECRVSPETRKRIIDAAEAIHYVPKSLAATDDNARLESDVIGVIQPNYEHSFFRDLTNEINLAVRKNGYHAMFFNTNEDPQEERRCLELCHGYKVAGVLINPCDNQANLEYMRWMKHCRVPMAFVDRCIYELDCDTISSDNYRCTKELTEALIKRGHRDILFLYHGEVLFTSVVKERFEGYCAAMAEHKLSPSKEVIYSKRSIEYQPIIDIGRFSAVVLSTSVDIFRLQELLDYMMYEDKILDVAVFDSFQIPMHRVLKGGQFFLSYGNILVMEQDIRQIAESAVEALIENIKSKNRSARKPKRILINGKLQETIRLKQNSSSFVASAEYKL